MEDWLLPIAWLTLGEVSRWMEKYSPLCILYFIATPKQDGLGSSCLLLGSTRSSLTRSCHIFLGKGFNSRISTSFLVQAPKTSFLCIKDKICVPRNSHLYLVNDSKIKDKTFVCHKQRWSETKQSLIISDRSLIISDRSLSFSRYQINIFQLDFPFLLLSISHNLEFCIYD